MGSTLRGGCHCGNVAVALDTARDPSELPLRACQCSFCRRQGARITTDPGGLLRIWVREPALLLRYRFGLGMTDFLLCGRCGVFVSAMMTPEGGALATLNVNVLEDGAAFQRETTAVSYDAESREARATRREGAWTPAELVEGAPPRP
jgi:hypothetical protein